MDTSHHLDMQVCAKFSHKSTSTSTSSTSTSSTSTSSSGIDSLVQVARSQYCGVMIIPHGAWSTTQRWSNLPAPPVQRLRNKGVAGASCAAQRLEARDAGDVGDAESARDGGCADGGDSECQSFEGRSFKGQNFDAEQVAELRAQWLREQKAEVSWIGFEPSDVYEAESPPSDGASSGVYEEEQPSDGASSGVSRLSEEKQEQPIPPCPEWVPSGVYEEEQEQEQPLAPSQEQLRERFERLMRRSQCRKGPGAGAADVAKDQEQEQEPPMSQRTRSRSRRCCKGARSVYEKPRPSLQPPPPHLLGLSEEPRVAELREWRASSARRVAELRVASFRRRRQKISRTIGLLSLRASRLLSPGSGGASSGGASSDELRELRVLEDLLGLESLVTPPGSLRVASPSRVAAQPEHKPRPAFKRLRMWKSKAAPSLRPKPSMKPEFACMVP